MDCEHVDDDCHCHCNDRSDIITEPSDLAYRGNNSRPSTDSSETPVLRI